MILFWLSITNAQYVQLKAHLCLNGYHFTWDEPELLKVDAHEAAYIKTILSDWGIGVFEDRTLFLGYSNKYPTPQRRRSNIIFAEWDRVENNNVILKLTEEFCNDTLLSRSKSWITPIEYRKELYAASSQRGCSTCLTKDSLAEITMRTKHGAKHLVTRYYRNAKAMTLCEKCNEGNSEVRSDLIGEPVLCADCYGLEVYGNSYCVEEFRHYYRSCCSEFRTAQQVLMEKEAI